MARKDFLEKTFALVIGIFSIMFAMFASFENVLITQFIAFETLVLCIVNVFKFRYNIVAFLLHLQLLYYNYSVIFSQYLYKVDEYQSFYANATDEVKGIGICALFVFELCMFLFSDVRKYNKAEEYFAPSSNSLISLGLLGIIVLIGIFGFDRGSLGTRGATTSMYEYAGLLFVLGLYYLGENGNKYLKILFSITIALLVIQGFTYGERVSGLQFMIIWMIFFLNKKIKNKHIMVGMVLGIVMMTVVGFYRNSYSIETLSISNAIDYIRERLLTFNGADLGYYCSLTFVMVAEKVTWSTRLDMFGEFLKSILVGSSSGADLPTFTRTYFSHWYGGYFPLYFYFYTGFGGMTVICAFFSKFASKCFTSKSHREYFKILKIYIVSTVARWYMYSPQIFFRSILFFTIGYIGLLMFHSTVRKANKRKIIGVRI